MFRSNRTAIPVALGVLWLSACVESPDLLRPPTEEIPDAAVPEAPASSAAVVTPAVAPAPLPQVALLEDGPQVFPLVAGQSRVVGSITVADEDGELTVTFKLDDPEYCLKETHVAIGESPDDIPQTTRGRSAGNAIPGQFDKSESGTAASHVCTPAEPTDEYTTPTLALPGGWAPGVPLVVAAHAELGRAPFVEDGIYGIDRQGSGPYDSDLYLIDVLTGAEIEIFDVADQTPDFQNAPNGLGYDSEHERWYWGDYGAATGPADVWFTDGVSQVKANAVPVAAGTSGATVWDGYYYFGAQETDEIYRVPLAGDGTFAAPPELWCTLPETYGWGDMAFAPDGTLYASTQGRGGSVDAFFTVSPECGYTLIADANTLNGPYAIAMQIAFGSDEALYAVDTGGQVLYSVIPETGFLVPVADLAHQHTDIASGYGYQAEDESAWAGVEDEEAECEDDQDNNAFGCDFPGRNWSTYVIYTGQNEVVYACPAITSLQGDVQWVAPLASVAPSSLANGPADAQAFAEYVGNDHGGVPVNVTPANTPVLDGSVEVADGEVLCSYYVNYDNGDLGGTGSTTDDPLTVATAALTFDAEIAGLIVAGTTNSSDIFWSQGYMNTLCETNGALGHPATAYVTDALCGTGTPPQNRSGDARGLEILNAVDLWQGVGLQDRLRVSPDRKTVEFSLQISNKHDAFRVLLNPVEVN